VSEPFLGQILTVPYTFAPKSWAFCNGQLLPISQQTALFSLLGTFYGGNGVSNFALPNLQGSVPVHVGGSSGQAPGLSLYDLGESGGEDMHVLTAGETPSHTHAVAPLASNDERTTDHPGNAYPTTGGVYASTQNSNAPMGAQATSQVGGQAHENKQPYLVLNYVIAMAGIFPART
jgi:microcystin-dependent protein